MALGWDGHSTVMGVTAIVVAPHGMLEELESSSVDYGRGGPWEGWTMGGADQSSRQELHREHLKCTWLQLNHPLLPVLLTLCLGNSTNTHSVTKPEIRPFLTSLSPGLVSHCDPLVSLSSLSSTSPWPLPYFKASSSFAWPLSWPPSRFSCPQYSILSPGKQN